MLLFDDSKGTADGKEASALHAMLAVGNEFMTFNDNESVVQRSGQFVRIEKKVQEDTITRFLLLLETSDAFSKDGSAVLDDGEFHALSPDALLGRRTWFFRSETEPGADRELAFKSVPGDPGTVRMPRFTRATDPGTANNHQQMLSACYSAIGGKRRVFAVGDGTVYVVRDVIERSGRFYYGLAVDALGNARRARAARVSRVDVVPYDPETGKAKNTVLSFAVASGLGVDVSGMGVSLSKTSDPSLPITESDLIRVATAGVWWGQAINDAASDAIPLGGDAGDTYAVAEPAVVQEQGKTYTSIVAVYAADDDVHDVRSSGAYRLTCKRTTVDGAAAVSKITLPALAGWNATYMSPFGLMLMRHSPKRLSLRVYVTTMQSGVPSDVAVGAKSTLVFWTNDNGATWSDPREVPGSYLYGGALAADKDTLLLFGTATEFVTGAPVVAVTSASITQVGLVSREVLNAGLYDFSDGFGAIPYLPRGFGGVVYRNTPAGRIKRLWMQFEPRWLYKQGATKVLDYPCGRPCLAVSDDGAATWQRRFLPTPWSFLVGFVVSIDASTLAVPVYAPRQEPGAPFAVTVHISKNGGESWQATGAKVTVPATTRIDGNIIFDQLVGTGHQQRAMQDISDAWTEYNPGELHPLIVLRDKDGKPLNSNPARPWMVDARIQEPANG